VRGAAHRLMAIVRRGMPGSGKCREDASDERQRVPRLSPDDREGEKT